MPLKEGVTQSQISQLGEQGYAVFSQVVDKERVEALRAVLERKLHDPAECARAGNSKTALFDIFGRYPETRWLLFDEDINEILRALVGPILVHLRATTLIHQSKSPWHNETTDMEKSGYTGHRQADNQFLQTVLYLQDNSGAYGPSLDLVPGSHNKPDPFMATPDKECLPRHFVSPDTRCGDLLVFDWRILHRGSPALDLSPGAPKKLGVFGSYTNKLENAEQYNDFSQHSESSDYMHDFAYPSELEAEARSKDIIMA